MSEKKLEECSLQEATHAESVTGEVYLISKSENRLRIVVEGYSIFNETWKALGIKPMKEKKREPVVFEATFVKNDGQWHTLAILNDSFAYLNNKRVRFRCVEILEEEE